MNISKAVKAARVLNGVAAGTTDQNGSVVDMQGFEVVQITRASILLLVSHT